MLTVESQMTVAGLTGEEITDFLLEPRDDRYQSWWPGTHLELHVTKAVSREDHVGDLILMHEYIGSRRVRLTGEVREVLPGERLVWQFRCWGLRLPVRLTLMLQTYGDNVRLQHTITAGWSGLGRALDPLWRLYFSRSFARAMDRHFRTEFPLLRDHLRARAASEVGTP